MRAAAEFDGIFAGFQHPHPVAVFLTKEGQRAHFGSGLALHLCVFDGTVGQDLFVHKVLNLAQFGISQRIEVVEVKPQTIRPDKGALLFDVTAQNLAQGPVDQVHGCVVALNFLAPDAVDLGDNLVTDADLLQHFGVRHQMARQISNGFCGVGDLQDRATVRQGQGSDVTQLTATLGVKRGAIKEHFGAVCTLDQASDARGHFMGIAADKFSGAFGIHDLAVGGCVVCDSALFALGPGTFALVCHQGGKGICVNGPAVILRNFRSDLQRKTVGVMQHKGDLAGQFLVALIALQFGFQNAEAGFQGAAELDLFTRQCLAKTRRLFGQFGIIFLVGFDHHIRHVRHNFLFYPKQISKPYRAADDPAQDVSAPFVAGDDPVRNQEGGRTHVVGNHPQGAVVFVVVAKGAARNARAFLHQCIQSVAGIKRGAATQHPDKTLKARAGVHVLMRQGC